MPSIVILERDNYTRSVLQAWLESAGYIVLACTKPSIALRAAAQGTEGPYGLRSAVDLIIADYQTSGGAKLCEEVRNLPAPFNTCPVILTGSVLKGPCNIKVALQLANIDGLRRALQNRLGCNDFVAKPFNPARLEDAAQQTLAQVQR